jgi:cytochrome c oxidase accessory protein FixG
VDFRSPASGLPPPAPAPAGDCVACNRCVQVCPTGIDIRQGLQLECIGCAACIDACDEVMTKVERPKGLIRYDSFAGLAGGRTRWLRPRTVVYAALMFVGAAVATYAFSTVKPLSLLVSRMTGAAYFVDRNDVRNQFLVRLENKRAVPVTFHVLTRGLPAGATQSGFAASVTLPAQGEQVAPLVIVVNRRDYTGPFSFVLAVQDETGAYEMTRTLEFAGPEPKLLQEEDRENGTIR